MGLMGGVGTVRSTFREEVDSSNVTLSPPTGLKALGQPSYTSEAAGMILGSDFSFITYSAKPSVKWAVVMAAPEVKDDLLARYESGEDLTDALN